MRGRDWKDHVEIDPRAVALDPIANFFFNSLSLMKFQLNMDQSNALRHTHTL